MQICSVGDEMCVSWGGKRVSCVLRGGTEGELCVERADRGGSWEWTVERGERG